MSMLAKLGTNKLMSVLVAAMLSLVCLIALSPSTLADDDAAAPALKAVPMQPQIDPSADVNHKSTPAKPLKAGIEHNEKLAPTRPQAPLRSGVAQSGSKGFMGKLRGGARSASPDTLKANANQGGFNIDATSGYGIIGVKFVLTLGKPPVINRVFAGTPAAKVGLQPNDTIVAVDGVPTYGLTKEEVYDLIIGSPGTSVSISIQRGADFRVVSCTRMDINDITDPLVRRDYMLNM